MARRAVFRRELTRVCQLLAGFTPGEADASGKFTRVKGAAGVDMGFRVLENSDECVGVATEELGGDAWLGVWCWCWWRRSCGRARGRRC
jgi:hypothetical protein